jgi:hypothetical protein
MFASRRRIVFGKRYSILFLALPLAFTLLICLVPQLLPQQVAADARLDQRCCVASSPYNGISLRLCKSETLRTQRRQQQRSSKHKPTVTHGISILFTL